MERSETIGDLIAALAKAQTKFTPALKESSNPYFGSKYADLATVIDAVRPALNAQGIALVQFNSSDLEHQTASVTTSLHFGEQYIAETMEAPAVGKSKEGKEKFDVQTLGAAWTYLRRYGIQSLCGLASEDDDGNALQNDNKPIARRQSAEPVSGRVGPTAEDFQKWHDEFAAAKTVHEFNRAMVPLVKERGISFVEAVKTEAKRRGYKPNRATGLYEAGGTTPPMYQDEIPTQDEYEAGYQERGGK